MKTFHYVLAQFYFWLDDVFSSWDSWALRKARAHLDISEKA